MMMHAIFIELRVMMHAIFIEFRVMMHAFFFLSFDFAILIENKMWNFDVLCRLYQSALRLGRWRSLRKTLQKEEVCQKQLLRKEKTIQLALCCSVSSSLLSLDHVRLSFQYCFLYAFY
jgi:hypothetical protein